MNRFKVITNNTHVIRRDYRGLRGAAGTEHRKREEIERNKRKSQEIKGSRGLGEMQKSGARVRGRAKTN